MQQLRDLADDGRTTIVVTYSMAYLDEPAIACSCRAPAAGWPSLRATWRRPCVTSACPGRRGVPGLRARSRRRHRGCSSSTLPCLCGVGQQRQRSSSSASPNHPQLGGRGAAAAPGLGGGRRSRWPGATRRSNCGSIAVYLPFMGLLLDPILGVVPSVSRPATEGPAAGVRGTNPDAQGSPADTGRSAPASPGPLAPPGKWSRSDSDYIRERAAGVVPASCTRSRKLPFSASISIVQVSRDRPARARLAACCPPMAPSYQPPPSSC